MDGWGRMDMPMDSEKFPAGTFRGAGTKRLGATTFSTTSRAHLRRAGPYGPPVNSQDGARAVEGMSAGATRRRWSAFTRGSRLCGAVAFAASLRRKPCGRGGCRARHPGDRPPTVPAVSRCRACQRRAQAVNVAAGCADRRDDVTATGPERRALSGAGPSSGPDGEGQAKGPARDARGETLRAPSTINNRIGDNWKHCQWAHAKVEL